MSAPDKPDHVKAWLFAEKIIDEEADRMAALSDEDFDAEMDAMPDPAHVPSTAELLARAERRASERAEAGAGAKVGVPMRTERRAWGLWIAAAALGAAIVAGVVERREVVAWLRHDTIPIGPAPWEPEQRVTAQERAAKLRDEAYEACAGWLWALCERKLDEARAMDPAGERDARVEGARRAVDKGLMRDAGRENDKRGPKEPK
jgi:hypothetical protein